MGKRRTIVALTVAWAAACNGNGGGPSGDGDGSGIDPSGTGTGIDVDQDEDTGDKLDVGVGSGGQAEGGDCQGDPMGTGDYEFSYIWIANSSEGTVSKVNTFTAIEEGRYRTGPDDPDPSRTSVNQHGDVAVANRNGGIVKIAAREDDCVDANGDGTIQTSAGPQDILPWGEDECVLWHHDLPAAGDDGPRPIAWEPVASGCGGATPRVWVGWWRGQDDDVGVFQRHDGNTGDVLDEVEVPLWNIGGKPTGPYGGAVNADGDFWVTGYYGPAIRIDAKTLDADWFMPPDGSGFYGMALDVDEGIWIGGCDGAIYHFDQGLQDFETIATIEGRARGVQVDNEGRAWFAGNNPCRLLMADTTSKTLVHDAIELPGCAEPVGVSIDVEGYVWVVDKNAQQAYKVDPETHAIAATVTGLVDPYTYSDMTGHGLALVANPPQG
jgi:streptogramin lyase